jgi:hypothetical protein
MEINRYGNNTQKKSGTHGLLRWLKIEIRLFSIQFIKQCCQHTWPLTKILQDINSLKYAHGTEDQFGWVQAVSSPIAARESSSVISHFQHLC